MKQTTILAILDGFGLTEPSKGNAVCTANKPNLSKLWEAASHTHLKASGLEVGLPEGQMGNSEVGHLNIGAGRKVYQSLVLITKSIEDKDFFQNEEYVNAMEHAKKHNSALHILGLLSDGGVHSHIKHIEAMIEMADQQKVEKVYVHAFLDGRDVDPKSAKKYVEQIQKAIDATSNNTILATISGRYYSMDRDKRWDRVELAYNTIICGDSAHQTDDYIAYIDEEYKGDITDEFIKPVKSSLYPKAQDNDAFIFMNFRPDRAAQLSGVLTNKDYNPKPEDPIFTPTFRPENIYFVQTMKYSDDVLGKVAYHMPKINNTLGEIVGENGMHQLRIAETEKYPHVTYFFDGGIEKEIPNAKRVLINSPKVATYDLKPEMSAHEVTEALLEELDKDYLDLVILNFANPDMVGHSGKIEPTIKAIETVDECMGQIIEKVKSIDGTILVTADHGNAEVLLHSDGTPHTAHTTNEVPFLLIDSTRKLQNKKGILADIAPTILSILGLEQPAEMTGESLIDE